jgi:hypothetical protein
VPNPYGQFVPDPLAPSGYRWARHGEQPATSMLPIVQPTPQPRPGGTVRYDEYEDHQLSGQDDGHVDPDEFPPFDGINSLMIRSIGAPE